MKGMKGLMYERRWFRDGTESGDCALWIPDATLLLTWKLPRPIVEVATCDNFPLPGEDGFTFIESRTVPSGIVKAARWFLKDQEHFRAQEELLWDTLCRNSDQALFSEERLRALLLKDHLPR